MVSLSIIFSKALARESNLASDEEVEGSSLMVTLFSVLYLALLAKRFASTLKELLCMSSRVVTFLSFNLYDMSTSKPSGNFNKAKPCGGLMAAGIALYRLLKRVQ
jgi:hypothetical protein